MRPGSSRRRTPPAARRCRGRSGASRPRTRAAAGSGWRPPAPGGAVSTASRSTQCAPGRCASSYAACCDGPPRTQRTSASTGGRLGVQQPGQLPRLDQHGIDRSGGGSGIGILVRVAAERQRVGQRRAGHRPGDPAPVMAPAEHLVRDLALPRRCRCRRSPPGHPSKTISPSIVRALWVARAPHQHSARTCSTSTLSHSSTSRCEPGNSRVWKSVRMPTAKTSICSSSTIRASWSTCRGGVELGLVADQVVDPVAAGQVLDDEVPEVEVRVHLDGRLARPSREEIVASPARSWLANSRPLRPLVAWV